MDNVNNYRLDFISKARAIKLCQEHGNSSYSELKDFIKQLGNKDTYNLRKVLIWLGY